MRWGFLAALSHGASMVITMDVVRAPPPFVSALSEREKGDWERRRYSRPKTKKRRRK